MLRTVTFSEWGRPQTVQLSQTEAARLASYSRQFRCEIQRHDYYRLTPRAGFVGAISLSRETMLIIEPRWSIDSVADLLSLAYASQRMPTMRGSAKVSSGALTAWFFNQFTLEAERLVLRNLRRDYRQVRKVLETPRGRILFGSRSPNIHGAHVCDFREYTIDSNLNRQVKGALAEIRQNEVAKPWRHKINQLVALLEAVGEEPFVPEAPLPREYMDYRPLFEMLKLYFDGKGTEIGAGPIASSAFFFQLYDVFERALFSALSEAASDLAIKSPEDRISAKFVVGEPHLGVTFRPDMGLKSRPTIGLRSEGGSWKLVVDAKYSSPLRRGRWRPSYVNEHIYQILTYAKVFGCPGILVYPRLDAEVDIRYRIDDTVVRIVTVDIASSSAEAMRELGRQLAREYAA